ELNEINQQLTFSAFLYFTWTDPNLKWTPATYNDTYYFTYPQENMWIPDITILNSVETMKELGYDRNYMYIRASGQVEWLPSGVFSTSCDIDVTYYPFDTQECEIIFTTLVSTNFEIDLDTDPVKSTELSRYSESGTWDLLEFSITSVEDGALSTRVAFKVKLKRLRSYYVLSIITPVIFLSFTATLVFALPADSGEKMGTSITVLLAFAVYLTIVSDQMPRTSLQVSYLAVYLTMLLGQTALGVVLSVWILNLHFRDDKHPPGGVIRKVVRILQVFMCWTVHKHSVEPATTNPDPSGFAKKQHVDLIEKDAASCDVPDMTWQMVAYTFDRFFFYAFSVLLSVLTVVFMLVLTLGESS
ncbi:hypothetical protein BaRGS_00010118, partial [Batillaria attramentaria]